MNYHPTVLIVEDEPIIRLNAVDVLECAGYNVVEAGNAAEAIEILANRTDIQVVFTDINMPGSMDGAALARAVRDRWPPVELILTSGHFNLTSGDLPHGSIFFTKPYKAADLIAAVQSVIRAP